MHSPSSINKKLLIILIFITIIIILLIPKSNEFPLPTSYGAGIDYGRSFIVNSGKISPIETNGTWQGLLVNYGNQDVFPKIIFASINIVTGVDQFPNDLYFLNIFVFSKFIFMPLFGLLAYQTFTKIHSNKRAVDKYVIFFFSLLPIASSLMLGPTSGVAGNFIAMAMMLLLLCLLVKNMQTENVRLKIVTIIIIMVFPMFWHTWSLYFIIILCVLLIGSYVLKIPRIGRLSLLGIITYFSIGLYLNFNQLITSPVSGLLSLIYYNKGALDIGIEQSLINYSTGSTIYSIFQILNSLFILNFILIFMFYSIGLYRNKKLISNNEKLLLIIIIGLIGCWGALFLLGGWNVLIMRLLEPAIPISIMVLSYSLNNNIFIGIRINIINNNIKKIIVSMAIASIIICLFSYSISTGVVLTMDSQEYVAEAFISDFSEDSSHYYSDFRLVTPLINNEKRNLHSPDALTQDSDQFNYLINIYYNYSIPSKVINDVFNEKNIIIITSEQQEKIGVCDPNFRLNPAKINFQTNFIVDDNLITVYSNNNVMVHISEYA